MAWVARYTELHPALWAPYRVIAYPYGFKGAPGEPDLPPVWMPEARIIGRNGHACLQVLDYDAPSIDSALAACWQHFAELQA